MNIGGESGTVGFKEGIGQLDEGLLSLATMLNSHGRGTVFFGVRRDGEVVGTEAGPDTAAAIRDRAGSMIRPPVDLDVRVRASEDGRTYVSAGAVGLSIPYSFDGRYYIRRGTSDAEAEQGELIGMVMSRGVDPLGGIPSDVQELTFEGLSMVLRSRRGCGDPGFLRPHGLLCEDGGFNATALLVSDQCPVPIQVVRFRGRDRTAIPERQDFGGDSLTWIRHPRFDFLKPGIA